MRTDGSSDRLGLLSAEGILLYDYRFIDPDQPSGLWFCADVETVKVVEINAVCLASGAKWDDLGKCLDFFRVFPYIVVVSVDRTKRETLVQELRRRIPATVFYVAEDAAFRGCSSVAELKATHGIQAVDEILLHTTELPAYGLLNVSDITTPKLIAVHQSGFPVVDRRIGAFYKGELSVWTGRRGEGKSTLLGEILLDSVDQGCKVCAYSGELPDWKFKYWISLQAAGPGRTRMQTDKRTGKQIPVVPEVYQKQIDDWMNRRFYLYDIGASATHNAEKILQLFTFANHAYGCNVFLVDNIMTARFRTNRDTDYYRAQSNFVADLVSFARRAGVHVHLVAHPRKTQTGRHLVNDDVGGIGDITNLADNVFALERSVRAGGKGEDPVEPTTTLAILKNRMWGAVSPKDQAIQLDFDGMCKRFFRSDRPKDKPYGWDKLRQSQITEVTGVEDDLAF